VPGRYPSLGSNAVLPIYNAGQASLESAGPRAEERFV